MNSVYLIRLNNPVLVLVCLLKSTALQRFESSRTGMLHLFHLPQYYLFLNLEKPGVAAGLFAYRACGSITTRPVMFLKSAVLGLSNVRLCTRAVAAMMASPNFIFLFFAVQLTFVSHHHQCKIIRQGLADLLVSACRRPGH